MTEQPFGYKRRQSDEVCVGDLRIGGDNPIRIQSMTTTSTLDTDGSVEQACRIIDAGGELVRLTTQGTKEAENLRNISAGLREKGYHTPIVADVHFNPNVAEVAALYAQKVRINPGNYVDPARTFKQIEYTDEQYADELQKIERRFLYGVSPDSQTRTIQRCSDFHQGIQHRGDGAVCPPVGGMYGEGTDALSAAPRCDGGW